MCDNTRWLWPNLYRTAYFNWEVERVCIERERIHIEVAPKENQKKGGIMEQKFFLELVLAAALVAFYIVFGWYGLVSIGGGLVFFWLGLGKPAPAHRWLPFFFGVLFIAIGLAIYAFLFNFP